MNEDCLRSIVYNFRDHVATLIYEPDCEYDLEAIAEYCDDMSDGRCRLINIFEGNELTYAMQCPAHVGSNGIAMQ
jgi:hypothetical protein